MKSIFWIILLIIFISAESNAQWRVYSIHGKEYVAVVLKKGSDTVSLKALDGYNFSLERSEIQLMQKITTRIETKNGEIHNGYITSITDDELSILPESKGRVTIALKDILKMDVEGGSGDNPLNIAKEASLRKSKSSKPLKLNEKKHKPYFLIGATFGGPTWFNLCGGYNIKDYGFRISGFILPIYSGIQLNILYNLGKFSSSEFNLSLGFGKSSTDIGSPYEPEEWQYLGAFIDMNLHGFFFEVGLVKEFNKQDPSLIKIQLGYVYRFVNKRNFKKR